MVKGKKERGLKIHIYFSCRFALWSFFSFGSQPKDKKVVKTKQLREDKYRGEKKKSKLESPQNKLNDSIKVINIPDSSG